MSAMLSTSKSANVIATYIVLMFIFILGITLFATYQIMIIESQEDLQEIQNEFVKASETSFDVDNATYDDSLQRVSFILTNTGDSDITTEKLSYFVNEKYGTDASLTSLDNISKNTQLLKPNSQLQVDFSVVVSEEEISTLKVVHDFGLRAFTDVEFPFYIGEAGSFIVQDNNNIIINFTRTTYSQPPALFMTPKTDNDGTNAPYAPTIHSINTTHANVSLCQDNGATTCDTTYLSEEVTYMAFDVNRTNNLSWIEVGFITTPTDGSTSSITFSNTFTNTPFMFAQPQTYNIDSIVSNGIAAHSWFPSASLTGAGIIGCDHPGTGNACAGTATEEFAYLAIDPTQQDIMSVETGTQSISNSVFTPISFTNPYSNPQLLVMQNSDTGGQDPQYSWARNVNANNAEIRYCEADAGGVCDGHSAETVRWMSIEDGPIEIIS